MPRLIADENLDVRILRGVLDRLPELDVVRAEDVGLRQTPDPALLEWAAAQGRLVVTHDVNTMPGYAYERVRAGLAMPGVIVIAATLPIGVAVDELATFLGCSSEDEWEGRVIFLPL